MKNIANAPTQHNTAFFAQFGGTPGILTKVEGCIIFLDTETNTVTTMTPANVHRLLTLDAVEHWVEQYYADVQAARLQQAERRP